MDWNIHLVTLLLLFVGMQSFTTVTYGWILGKIDIDSAIEDIGVPCLVNGETAGCKDQCIDGSSGNSAAETYLKRKLLQKTNSSELVFAVAQILTD